MDKESCRRSSSEPKPCGFYMSLSLDDLQDRDRRMCLDGPFGWCDCRTLVSVASSVHEVMCCCLCLLLIPQSKRLSTYFQPSEAEIASSSSPEQRSNYTFVIGILTGSLMCLSDEYGGGFVTTHI